MLHSFSDINKRLCHMCGTCVAVCPIGIIKIEDENIGLSGTCTSCGSCYSVCPGIELSLEDGNRTKLGREYIGSYLNLYSGFAADPTIRQNGSSGGVATALASYLLKEKLVDRVVTVCGIKGNDADVSIQLSGKVRDAERAAGSKYLLVPLNSILKELSSFEGEVAIFGLPCHLHGIYKMEQEKLKLAKKIRYKVGLFCGFNMSYKATKDIINKVKANKNQIASLRYRGGKYPGGFRVSLGEGVVHQFTKELYNFLNFMYVPYRCMLCPDLTAETSDISLGDFWIKGKEKRTMIIVRKKEMDKILKEMALKNEIFLENASYDEIYKSHKHLFKYKKHGVQVRMKILKDVPRYNIRLPQNTLYLKIYGYFIAVMILIAKTRFFHFFFYLLPIYLVDSLSGGLKKIVKRI